MIFITHIYLDSCIWKKKSDRHSKLPSIQESLFDGHLSFSASAGLLVFATELWFLPTYRGRKRLQIGRMWVIRWRSDLWSIILQRKTTIIFKHRVKLCISKIFAHNRKYRHHHRNNQSICSKILFFFVLYKTLFHYFFIYIISIINIIFILLFY